MLEKIFDFKTREQEIYARWEEGGAFACGEGGEPFCVVIPPPNITGTLHIGHALNTTLQDVFVRFERMRGKDVLWQPGVDHAGIATQMVVERALSKEGETRHNLGREAFLERVWAWKEHSGSQITRQLRKLGASCDWSRERFTMDEGLSAAVLEVFVRLYKEGLIYRDKRLVNWDPQFCTAISDLEVQSIEVQGSLWYVRYEVEGEPSGIVIATTRPETILADTAIAVFPEDERYRHLIGKKARVPLVGRWVPIVGDNYCDQEKGTGALKVTPAHDFNDFAIGKRHGLPLISLFNEKAALKLSDNPEFLEEIEQTEALKTLLSALDGQDRFEARTLVVAQLEALGVLEKIEPHVHAVPHGDRSGVVIEPYLTDQWYVRAEVLAQPAIAAVERGDMVFSPKNWEKTYFEWMRAIEPWCISRQLWWGHRIPAWYGPDGRIFVEKTEQEAQDAALAYYGGAVSLIRDPDVLDTWFSSALWPFSTLGWPEKTPEFSRYYPTSLLVTAFDIIFFWVARMMMMGLHFTGQVPFKKVLIHALVRDEKGQKMSKSKGNSLDPLALIEKYGADALRFGLAVLAVPGRDVRLSENRIEGFRNFVTKVWNAARFCELNGCREQRGIDLLAVRSLLNRWILDRLFSTVSEVTQALTTSRVNDAAQALYAFVWDVYCDWYLELIKPVFTSDKTAEQQETRHVAGFVFHHILVLLHPFMPFVTEEIWEKIRQEDNPLEMIRHPWPSGDFFADPQAREEAEWVIGLISEIRSVRSEVGIKAGLKIPCVFVEKRPEYLARIDRWRSEILRLARLEHLSFEEKVPPKSLQVVYHETVCALIVSGVLDFASEKQRLTKELETVDAELSSLKQRLGNEGFLAKAPLAVVEASKERQEILEMQRKKLLSARDRLRAE